MKKTLKPKNKNAMVNYGDIIQLNRSTLYSSDMKCYSLHEDLFLDEIFCDDNFAIVLDEQPNKEIDTSGKLKVFVKNQVIYLHYSDFNIIS